MKEYLAETGGRYTYSDDILNLQELALSLASIFDGCSDFIISGCEVDGERISGGYVWLGGKVRRFDGCADAAFPYYLYEVNRLESVVYANEVNKQGRACYLCAGGRSVPGEKDGVTGRLPAFIEMTKEYSPRFIDKFFGRYAVLLETPFSRQTVKKDILLAGTFTAEKDLLSKTAVSVSGKDGYLLKGLVRTDGNASLGAYLNGLLVNEIILHTDGSFSLVKQGKVLARVTENGLVLDTILAKSVKGGSVVIRGNHLFNADDVTDEGSVCINYYGKNGEGSRFRNFAVYDGRKGSVPLLLVIGKTGSVQVSGTFTVRNAGKGMELHNLSYTKENPKLMNLLSWKDSTGETMAHIGYDETGNFRFALKNSIGDIVLAPQGAVDVLGTLKVNGTPLGETYVTRTDFAAALKKKVDTVSGKGLSTEDFTTDYKRKLDAISTGELEGGKDGYVTASDMRKALKMKLSANENLLDVMDKAAARRNIGVYSKGEADNAFLKIASGLKELVELSAEEIEGRPLEEITALKEKKQAAVRDTIRAEKSGTGDLKLAKSANLSDLPDKAKARQNIDVYSKTDVDKLLESKLGTDSAYQGAVFTKEMKQKLEGIKSGSFAYTDSSGSHAQVEGYVSTSQVAKELAGKAGLLLDGYSNDQKNTIAANLGVYTKTVADGRFAILENLLQDYIDYLVKKGKKTAEARKMLRDKLDVLSSSDVSGTYLRKDGKLSDLILKTAEAKRQACQAIGAAFASDYQAKLKDTGWMRMNDSGGTDTRQLYIRQIGNIVSIQGVINTSRRDGGNWGGIIGIIPNSIQPPAYSIRCTAADWNDDTKYNRGTSFKIFGGTRQLRLYERGMYGVDVELNFTYFT